MTFLSYDDRLKDLHKIIRNYLGPSRPMEQTSPPLPFLRPSPLGGDHIETRKK